MKNDIKTVDMPIVYVSITKRLINSTKYLKTINYIKMLSKKCKHKFFRSDFRISNESTLQNRINSRTKQANIVFVIADNNFIDDKQYLEVAIAKMNSILTLAFDGRTNTIRQVINFNRTLGSSKTEYGYLILSDDVFTDFN